MRKILGCFIFIMIMITSQIFATTYYVDATNGNDNNSGTSPATAWKTIAKVNDSFFNPGDFILFKRGEVWREQLIVSSSGSPGNPITFGAYESGDKPIINGSDLIKGWTNYSGFIWQATFTTEPRMVFFDGTFGDKKTSIGNLVNQYDWYWNSNILYVYSTSDPDTAYANPGIEVTKYPTTDGQGLIHISGKNYITINGIDIKQSHNHFVKITNSSDNIIVKNQVCSYSYHGGIIATGGSTNIYIQNNTVSYTNMATGDAGYHEGITVEGIDGFEISGNTVHHCNEESIDAKYGATNGEIFGNTVHDPTYGGIYIDGGTHINIYRNELHDCPWWGAIQLGIEINSYPTSDINIYYNLFYNNTNGIVFWTKSGITTDIQNVNIYNNTFYNNENGIYWKTGVNNNYVGNNNIKNNIIWCNYKWYYAIKDDTYNEIGIFNSIIEYNAFQNTANSETLGNNSLNLISANFVDEYNYNFMLKNNSSCIDRGIYVGLTEDYVRNKVPWGQSVDIGAFEYQGSTSPLSAEINASPTSGYAPLNVNFTASA
ncbi:MAG: right-handed parallel beta-helix repeat-containing protein, partial [Promethearchaeota archaeon]